MKKLLLGLGSVASVIAPVAAVISCGDEVSVTEIHGENGTDAQTTTTVVTGSLATTLNTSVTTLEPNLVPADITATEKVTNFVIGSMHPVTYGYAVSYTLAAKNHGLHMNIGNTSVISGVHIKAGDKLIIAAKMPKTTRRAAVSVTSPIMPEMHVILLPKDADTPPTDSRIIEQSAIQKLANEILFPAFPTVNGELGRSTETTSWESGPNPMTWTDLLDKIKGIIKPTTTEVSLEIGSSKLRITFAAGANDAALKMAVTNAVTGNASFANCIDMTL